MSKNTERRELILDAALSIADRDGVEGLTLRKIESETGLSAPLVYRHFRDKAAIVEGLVERLLAGNRPDPPSREHARTWVEETFASLYRSGRAHSSVLTLLSSADALQAQALRMTEQTLDVLRLAGLDAARAGHAFQLLLAFTVGSAMMARGTQLTNEMLADALARYPLILASGPYLDARDEQVFSRGLATLLDALQI